MFISISGCLCTLLCKNRGGNLKNKAKNKVVFFFFRFGLTIIVLFPGCEVTLYNSFFFFFSVLFVAFLIYLFHILIEVFDGVRVFWGASGGMATAISIIYVTNR